MTILTPDQRVRVFISSTLEELAPERNAACEAILAARFIPVLFELGARPHPPRDVYRAYLEQSHVFVGIYWQHYGWIAPEMEISGLEDEYDLAAAMPRLIYVKRPGDGIEPRLADLIRRIGESGVSYRLFEGPEELADLLRQDLALLVSERFSAAVQRGRPCLAIPAPLSSFVGREKEVNAVVELVGRRDVRLLTLTGPGGIGKTRLAVEAATRLAPHCEAEVVWVGLASLRDPRLVSETIARRLEAGENLAEYIGERELVLLLDNFEQVIEAAPDLASLLAACPKLRLLVTSRELLRVQGELEFPVPPLARPDAVSLFCARSSLEPSEAIGELCSRLDNLPLAVELAAARTRVLSPVRILERLTSRLDLLRGGRDAHPRQQTLRATIEWSYELLSPEEQRLFGCLSVFAASCTLEAADEVCGANLNTLQSLVEKSLLRFSEDRYSMLETIREYAGERLAESGEAEEQRDRHAAYFLELAKREGPLMHTALQSESRKRIAAEESNLRVSVARLNDRSPERLSEFVSALFLYWTSVGRVSEIQAWAERALEYGPPESSVLRADALLLRALAASRAGEVRTSIESAEEAIDIYEAWQSPRLGRALAYLASSYLRSGSYGEARSALQRAIDHAERSGDDWARALALSNLGYLSLILGEYADAEAMSFEAAELKRELGNEIGVAEVLCNAGLAALLDSRFDEARKFLGDAGRASVDLRYEMLLACCLEGFSCIAARSGDLERAARLQGAAESRMARVGGQLDRVEQEIHGETRARIQAVLGAQASEEELAIGRSLSADAAIAYALEQTAANPRLQPVDPRGQIVGWSAGRVVPHAVLWTLERAADVPRIRSPG